MVPSATRSGALRVGVLAVFAGALAVVGCASQVDDAEPASISGPWAQEFRRVHDEATTDFVRAVVEDGELTLAEMREAVARTLECWGDLGYAPGDRQINEIDGTFQPFIRHFNDAGEPIELHDPNAVACELDYFNELRILWDLIRVNPDAEDFDELAAECLVRNDLAEPGFTGRHFREAAMACAVVITDPENPTSPEDGQAPHDANDPTCRPQLPGGTYLDEGTAWDCRMDPLNS